MHSTRCRVEQGEKKTAINGERCSGKLGWDKRGYPNHKGFCRGEMEDSGKGKAQTPPPEVYSTLLASKSRKKVLWGVPNPGPGGGLGKVPGGRKKNLHSAFLTKPTKAHSSRGERARR